MLRQRQPRVRDKKYLAYIADLGGPHGYGCVICRREAEVAHVRFAEICETCVGSGWATTMSGEEIGLAFDAITRCPDCENQGYRFGKTPTGMGSKSDDKWTVPLCPDCHRLGKNAQHSMNEREWWAEKGIDVLALCRALQAAYEMADRLQAGVFVLEQLDGTVVE